MVRRAGWVRALVVYGGVALLLALPARAETPQEIFERGNSAYEDGRYDEAVEAYNDLLRYRVLDPVVQYNLANAEFRLGHLGRAILHFERARRLDPTDDEIAQNLSYARSLTPDKVEPPAEGLVVRWIQSVQDRVGPDRQAWSLLIVVWIIGALVAWCSSRPRGWTAAHGWGLALLLLLLLGLGASWISTHDRVHGTRLAVVLVAAAEVLAGPGGNNAALTVVHEGLTLEVRSEREEWVQVSLPNGLNGWIERAALGFV